MGYAPTRGRTFRVEVTKIHPDFDVETLKSNVALLHLQTPADDVDVVCLPEAGHGPHFLEQCISTGWGTLSTGILSILSIYLLSISRLNH